MNLKEFETRLTEYIAKELGMAIQNVKGRRISSFDLGIHPWHGSIEMSLLLEEEMEINGNEYRFDIAAWKFYNINDLASNESNSLSLLTSWMERNFSTSRYWKYDKFFAIAARIVNSKEIQNILNKFDQTKDFYCSVYDPDDAKYRNYCSGYRRNIFQNTFLGKMIQDVNELNE